MFGIVNRQRVRFMAPAASLRALGLGLLFASTPVFAQSQDAAAPQDEGADEQIVVTGSRIARSGFDQPTPVTVLGAEQMGRQAVVNVAQALNDLPSFRPQATPTTNAIFSNNIGASTADLRGLGANRTLVLINGRRVVASTVQGGSFASAGAVDLSLIPTSLVQRAEVVTGGASAAYGSDAVAGVVNIMLDTRLNGIKGSAQYGINDAGDNKQYMLSLAGGTSFADGRGHIVAGVEYSDDKGARDCYSRDWCALSYNTVSNPFLPGSTTQRVGAGLPATLILPNARTAAATVNGIIARPLGPVSASLLASGLIGTEFNPNGTTFAHNYGSQYYNAGLFQSGGGDPRLAFYENFALSAPVERLVGFGHAEYEVTDGVNLFVEASYGRVKGSAIGAQRRDLANINIQRDNAYLPDAIKATMATYNLTQVPFGRVWNDIGPQYSEVTRENYRAVVGIKAEMWADWTFDAYYQYGRTDYSQRGYNTTITPRMNYALDAVKVGDTVVCRGVRDGVAAAAGCVPINPFGAGNISAPAKAYVTGTVMQDTKLTQNVVAASMQGTLFEGWAGPIKAATGAEIRQDIARGDADPISRALQFYTGPGSPISGKVDVFEAFGELSVPLFQGAELNGALRYTDYSTSGDVTSWKIGADYAPLDWLRFRGTRSRDIRAPNLFELFGPTQTSFQSLTDRGAQVLPSVLIGGNSALVPEEADTWTVGVVLQPNLGSAGRLRLSVDYYDIQLNNAVSTLGGQVIVNGCANGISTLCDLITRNSAGTITEVVNRNINLGSLITRGWDIEAQYTLPLNLWGGDISVRGLATIVDDLITNSASGVVDRAGMNGSPVSAPSGVPRYTLNGYLTYSSDRVTAQLQVRHIAGGVYNAELVGPGQAGYDPLKANSVNDNHIGAWTYVNLNASVNVWQRGDQKLEIFGVVNNLFDKDPPVDAPSSFGPTNNVLYDVLGRTYRMGARFKF
ncbi:MAG: TonB-dependent receptor [Sphingomonadales bacterium]|nr:TonB-dependent receptor [Sphingomonadales bacterium]